MQKGATERDIAAAYKRLALKHHPDKNPDNKEQAEREFLRVSRAYEALRDPAARRACGPGGLGSYERAEELYQAYFGQAFGEGDAPRIDVAGIFSFLDAPKARAAGRSSSGGAVAPGHALPAGAAVGLRGLRSRPELNGKSAQIGEWSEAKGRYKVRLPDGCVLSLCPKNLVQLCTLEVTGSEEHPELNGQRGEVVEYKEDEGCYTVLMHDPASIAELPRASCIFDEGTPVTLRGLSDEQLNGQMAQILSVDRNAARYLVRCQHGRQVRVKFDRVLC